MSPETQNPIPRDPRCGWNLDNSYARLPEVFFQRAEPERFPAPRVVALNRALAEFLGFDPDGLESHAADFFGGRKLPPNSTPIAQAYAGHQYAHLTMLGDGRALLLGEQIAPDGSRWDVHLKGSGRTAFSRRGDGKAVLGPMLREFLVSEAMAALGIPTTRALAVLATGETVPREEPLPGAVLVRIAASHIRVGTFEYAARCGNPEAVRILVDYTLRRHFPGDEGSPVPALRLLQNVVRRQAALVAQWMSVGFVHGVMNTDNMALSGETIDYGPCAFIDEFDPGAVFSSIDHHGRYAYRNQPHIARWNLARLAECLLREIDPAGEKAVALANAVLEEFQPAFEKEFRSRMLSKLGFFSIEHQTEAAAALPDELLDWMETHRADFTATFRALCDPAFEKFLPEAAAREPFKSWREKHMRMLEDISPDTHGILEQMRSVNPAVIPRNHLVADALRAAEMEGDLRKFTRLLDALCKPFETPSSDHELPAPPPPGSPRITTFCGT